MFNLMQGLIARELVGDRVREAGKHRLRRDARGQAMENHRREVERGRASVLLVRRNSDEPWEA
jgi:hypothetical protein